MKTNIILKSLVGLLTINPRAFVWQKMLAIASSMGLSGFDRAEPVSLFEQPKGEKLPEGVETQTYYSVFESIMPDSFKLNGKTFDKGSVLSACLLREKALVDTNYVTIDGRTRQCAAFLAMLLTDVDLSVCGILESASELDRLAFRRNAIKGLTGKLSGLDVVRQTTDLYNKGLIERMADIEKDGVRHGTAQRAFTAAKLVKLHSAPLASVESLPYKVLADLLKQVEAGVDIEQALSTVKAVVSIPMLSKKQCEELAKETTAPYAKALLQAVAEGSLVSARLALKVLEEKNERDTQIKTV